MVGLNSGTISYGIGRNYLSHWGITEALREILQNFLDFGEYGVEYKEGRVTIDNSFKPDNLDFLALGNSVKSEGSRGKYGEGLKMAFLIFAREGLEIEVKTSFCTVRPLFITSPIGEILAVDITEQVDEKGFRISFELDEDVWDKFLNSVIKEEDIIFDDNYYGRIVDKEAGNIYCGGLFVNKVDNLKKSYDINVPHLPLTRDRSLPKTFDVNWATSKINEKQGKLDVTDLTYSDSMYLSSIPEEVKSKIKPVLVGNSIEAVYSHEGNDVVIKNDSVRDIVMKDSFFKKVLNKLRGYLLEKMGLLEMLEDYKKNYVWGTKETEAFDRILDKARNTK